MEWHESELYAYSGEFIKCLLGIEATGRDSSKCGLSEGIKEGIEFILSVRETGDKLIFVGNGGSATIASHQATDFIRTCKIRTFAPLDPSLLTCMANDCGYEYVFSAPLNTMAGAGDVLVAISSSGQSRNIINAVKAMKGKGCFVITLSGFKPDNPLWSMGDINFYVPSESYRFVESSHLFICNLLLDFTIRSLEKKE